MARLLRGRPAAGPKGPVAVLLLATRAVEALSLSIAESRDACLEIAASADGKPAPEGANAVYARCQQSYPSGLVGSGGSSHNCHEIARLYQMARHYNPHGLTKAEFCATVQGLDADSRLADHHTCVAAVTAVLTSKEVADAAGKACAQVYRSTVEAPIACKTYVAALAAAPQAGLLDTGRLCDVVLTGDGKGTQGFDGEHFLYSCVQFADNVMDDIRVDDASPEHVEASMSKAQQSCEAHIPTDSNFCSSYVGLLRRQASRAELVQFCGDYDRKNAQSKTQPSSRFLAPAQVHGAIAPVAASMRVLANTDTDGVRKTNMGSGNNSTARSIVSPQHAVEQACHEYAEGIQHLGLLSNEAAKTIERDCPTHFGASTSACAEAATLFVAGKMQQGCQLVATQSTQHPAGLDLSAVCRRTIAKVAEAGLRGAAQESAATDICGAQLRGLPELIQIPLPRAGLGCRILAKRLAAEVRQHGRVDAASFCTSLTGGGARVTARTTTATSPAPPAARPPGGAGAGGAASGGSGGRGLEAGEHATTSPSRSKATPTKEFLKAFVRRFGGANGSLGGGGPAAPATPGPAAAPPPPSPPPAAAAHAAASEVGLGNASAAFAAGAPRNDDTVSSFLKLYEEGGDEEVVEPTSVVAAGAAMTPLPTNAEVATLPPPSSLALPDAGGAAPQGGDADSSIDSIVSSFLAQQSAA